MSVNYRQLYKEHYEIEFGSEFVVHHIDGNRSNNSIGNLLLLPRVLHSKYHEHEKRAKMCLNAYGGLCVALTPNDTAVLHYQFSEIKDFFEIIKEIRKWIDLKTLADSGYVIYPMFEDKEVNRGDISQSDTALYNRSSKHNA